MARRLITAIGIAFFAIWLGCVYRALGIELGMGSAYLVLGTLGLVFALTLAFPKLATAFARALEAPKTWLFLLVTSLAAVAITLWLSLGPMGGMPASLDGSVYVFQGRALAHFSYGHPIPPPRLPFGVRFLFEGADGKLHGVFPVGQPLFLAPFLAVGSLHLGLATIAVGLVLVQYAVGKALTKNEVVARTSVLLTLPSWGRAIETAEPLSHALVAICVGLVLVLTLKLPTSRKPFRLGLLLGAAGAWAFITRLLDGFVVAFVFGPLLLYWAAKKRIPRSTIAAIVLGALPFLAVIFGQQHAATGSVFRANVVEYALRSDWPPGCLRLGIGKDIGCTVEHPAERESFGPDGYQLDDAFRLVRERAEVYGFDLVGSAILFLLAFAPLMLAMRRDEATPEPDERSRITGVFLATTFVVALTLVYGLYYYGNHPAWGARHLYASSPFAFALIALAAERFASFAKKRPVAPALTLALLAATCVSAWPMWKRGIDLMREYAEGRVDVRALIEEHDIERGIVTTLDLLAYLNGYDPWTDGDQRFVVFDGPDGVHDLRRLHPSLPVYHARPLGILERVEVEPPSEDGFFIELERAWPAFMRPSGLGATFGHARMIFGLDASSAHGLYIFEAAPQAKVTIPIWIPKSGRYAVRLHYFEGPDIGDYKITLDGHTLPLHRGYRPEYGRVASPPTAPIELEAGPHLLVVECLGKHAKSKGYRALFDALSGTMVEQVEKAALP